VCMILSQKITIVTSFIKIFVSVRKLFWLKFSVVRNVNIGLYIAMPNRNSHCNNCCTLIIRSLCQ
jgi:hypothetical protein